MAAAYAALVSLLNTLDQIQNHIQIHRNLSNYFNNYPNESLREKTDFLLHFVEKFSSDADSCGEAEDLLRRIAVVAHEAEDIIEVHAARAVSSDFVIALTQRNQKLLLELQRKIDEMDSIKKQIIMIKEGSSSATPATPMVENNSEAEDLVRRMAVVAVEGDEVIQVQPADPINDEHSLSLLPDMHNKKEDLEHLHQEHTSSSAKTNNMVGFDGYLEYLLDQLTRQHSGGRQILPIVGMGGIGKTTLARNVYDNLLIVEHFYVRVWVIVSQEFSVRDILLQALSCLGVSTTESETDINDGELALELHKILYGQRYLIVLDDVWSSDAWDQMKSYFPENNNGSRIVITTRQTQLVGYIGSSALTVDLLGDENSWELFREKMTFSQKGCPPELQDAGRKIVRNCKGLPLAITVVGGLLRRSPRTQEYWEKIAKDKNMILGSEEDNGPWSILYLSYKHLPVWLKSCFLYLGLFPEDHRFKVSQLIKLWIGEGFIKPNKNQSLEEVAENYVKELVDRNLVLVGDSRVNKKPKTCFVHDVVRDLCVRIAEKENVYCVQRDIDELYQFVVEERTARYFEINEVRYVRPSHTPSLVRPFEIFLGYRYRPQIPNFSRLLRIYIWDKFDQYLFREVNLRVLIHEPSDNPYKVPPSISRLWSLQTLIFTPCRVMLPCEIWKMPQLRHIKTSQSARLPHPPPSDDMILLPYLQTLKTVEDFILSEEVCKIIPNIKNLGIIYTANAQGEEANSSSYHLHNLGCFSKLETLQCSYRGYKYVDDVFGNLKVPSDSLKKLSLEGCKLVWSDMAMFGSLPHLQILKLLRNAVVGAEWNCVEGEFLCLKYLQISDCDDLTYWSADNLSFPVLETLCLDSLTQLEEIPSGIGEVPTLEKIEMYECSKSANISAVKMLEEQVENLGNLGLHLQITFQNKWDAQELRKEIEELDITCQNLRIFGKWDQ